MSQHRNRRIRDSVVYVIISLPIFLIACIILGALIDRLAISTGFYVSRHGTAPNIWPSVSGQTSPGVDYRRTISSVGTNAQSLSIVEELHIGWPMRCVLLSTQDNGTRRGTTYWSSATDAVKLGRIRLAPWSNVLVGWALVALLLLGLSHARSFLIRRSRRRRGMCCYCKYPIQTLVPRCPECGENYAQ